MDLDAKGNEGSSASVVEVDKIPIDKVPDAPAPEMPEKTLTDTAQAQDEETDKVSPAALADEKSEENPVADDDRGSSGEGGVISMSEVKTAIDELDEDIENAFGRAADSIWSLASSVGSAVREHQPGLDNLRKNVSSRLAPVGSQIASLAPKEESLANFTGSVTGSVRSVAATVQRNAVAVEEAILKKANSIGTEPPAASAAEGASAATRSASDAPIGSPSMLPLLNQTVGRGLETVDRGLESVDKSLARVGDSLKESLVGQTVGGLWDGLWGGGDDDEDGDDSLDDEPVVEDVPRNRFAQRLLDLQANPDTYCKPAADMEAYTKWCEGFVLDEYAKKCVAILHQHAAIAELYMKVVPGMVEEDTFWMRYFFAESVLEKEEDRRRKLLERAETAVASGAAEEEEDGWGDDDWEADEAEEEKPLEKETAEKESGKEKEGEGAGAAGTAGVTADSAEVDTASGGKESKSATPVKAEIPIAQSTSKDAEGGLSDDDDWE